MTGFTVSSLYGRDYPTKFYVSYLVFCFFKIAILLRKFCHCIMLNDNSLDQRMLLKN